MKKMWSVVSQVAGFSTVPWLLAWCEYLGFGWEAKVPLWVIQPSFPYSPRFCKPVSFLVSIAGMIGLSAGEGKIASLPAFSILIWSGTSPCYFPFISSLMIAIIGHLWPSWSYGKVKKPSLRVRPSCSSPSLHSSQGTGIPGYLVTIPRQGSAEVLDMLPNFGGSV